NYAFALQRKGFLMLGKAEALQSRTSLFEPFDLKHRVFVKNPHAEDLRTLRAPVDREESAGAAVDGALREASFDQAPVAQLVVDSRGASLPSTNPHRPCSGSAPRNA